METLRGFPNPRPLPPTQPTARCARPPALWLRWAKPSSADAFDGTLRGFPNLPALWLRWAKPSSADAFDGTLRGFPNLPALWLRWAKPSSADAIASPPQTQLRCYS